MADTVSLTVQLVDKVSGGAKKASQSIQKLTDSTVKFNSAGRAIDKTTGKFVKLTRWQDKARAKFKDLAKSIFSLSTAASIFKSVGRSVLVAATGFFKASIKAEALSSGIGVFLKDAAKGKKAFADLIAISNKTGLSIEAAATTFRALSAPV